MEWAQLLVAAVAIPASIVGGFWLTRTEARRAHRDHLAREAEDFHRRLVDAQTLIEFARATAVRIVSQRDAGLTSEEQDRFRTRWMAWSKRRVAGLIAAIESQDPLLLGRAGLTRAHLTAVTRLKWLHDEGGDAVAMRHRLDLLDDLLASVIADFDDVESDYRTAVANALAEACRLRRWSGVE